MTKKKTPETTPPAPNEQAVPSRPIDAMTGEPEAGQPAKTPHEVSAYARISVVGNGPEGSKRPEVKGTAYAYTEKEWDALRAVAWVDLDAYVANESRRRKIIDAEERAAKAADKVHQLKAAQ